MSNVCVISTRSDNHGMGALAKLLGGVVTAITVGVESFPGADKLICIDALHQLPAEACAPQVARLVRESDPDIILVPNRATERVLGGAIAACLHAPLFSTRDLCLDDSTITVSRYSGLIKEKYSYTGPIVIVTDYSSAHTSMVSPASIKVPAEGYTVEITSDKQAVVEEVSLPQAERIVAVGRGFRNREDLALAADLAKVLGAELAATRPLIEGEGWFGRERYIGISGQVVSPRLYIAIGISGQSQHVAGMEGSHLVVAINEDPEAPIFEESDYGIVGDLYEVLPRLVAALK